MSWPGADDDVPPSDAWLGDVRHDRPTDPATLGTLSGKSVNVTDEQAEQALKLLGVPFENLKSPPFFAPLFGYTTSWQRKSIARSLIANSLAAGRVVTPAEADVIAQHRSKVNYQLPWAYPAALVTAGYLTHRGRSRMRFPFYTPHPGRFSPLAFPSAAAPFLTGLRAGFVWNALRFGAYYVVCKYSVVPLFQSVVLTKSIFDLATDPRLKDIDHLIVAKKKAKARQVAEDSAVAAPGRPSSWRKPEEEEQQGHDDDDQQQQQEQQQQEQQQQQQKQQEQQQLTRWAQQAKRDIESQGARQNYDIFGDGASPVAPAQGQQSQHPAAGSPPPPGAGSYWDKIRQRAKAEEGAPWQGQQQSGEPQGQQTTGQHTYTPAEQEKAYAKEQAQKEFDAMLERERRGIDDSGARK